MQNNVELVHRSIGAINHRDLRVFLELMAADVTVQPQFGDRDNGDAGIGRWWKAVIEGISDLAIDLVELRDVADDITLANVRARGQSAMHGVPFEQAYWVPACWRDGECVWWGVFIGEQDALKAAGLLE